MHSTPTRMSLSTPARVPLHRRISTVLCAAALAGGVLTALAATPAAATPVPEAAPAAPAAATLAPEAPAVTTDPIQIAITGLAAAIPQDGSAGTTGSITVTNISGADVNLSDTANEFAVRTTLAAPGLTAVMVTQAGSTIINWAGIGPLTWGASGCPANSVCGTSFPAGIDPAPADHFATGYSNGAPLSLTLDTRTAGQPSGITGTLTITVAIVEVNGTGTVVRTLGTGTSATRLASPSAPSVAHPPAATLYQAYSHQLSNLGIPAATQARITVYRDSGAGPVALPSATTYALNNGLILSTVTGVIGRPITATDTADPAPDRYTVILNNGVGGTAAPKPATSTTPALIAHDVMIQFTIPVMFSDVPAAHPFAAQIYRMADAGIVKGNTNGTFRPAADVSRQAFASFAVKYLNRAHDDLGISFAPFGLTTPLKTGSCTAQGTTSAFVDVSDSSQFCMEIKQLAALGITTGYNEFSFQPTINISRQAISAMMYRMDRVVNGFSDPKQIAEVVPCSGASGFKDVPASNSFCGQIQWMNATGISTGYAGGTYRPLAASSRQAVIAFIDRMGKVDGLPGFGS